MLEQRIEIVKPKITWKPAHPSNMRPGRPFNVAENKPFGVELIVVHVMDGSLFGSTTEIQSQLPQGQAKSWHYGIGWDWPNRSKVGLIEPEIFQHVRMEDTAFHAGTVGRAPISKLVRSRLNPRIDPNAYSLGIECHGTASVWHKALTPTLVHLIAWLCWHHSLEPSRDTIVGHFEIDGDRRKNCPGKNCPLDRIVKDVQKLLALDGLKAIEEFRGT